MTSIIARRILATASLSIMLLTAGCATYSERINGLYQHLERQQPTAALAALDKAPGPARDRLAYLLNRAMLLRMNADYDASNQAFEQAKTIITQLEAISLAEQGGTLAINEAMSSYAGEAHEQVLLHLYAALNYLQLGQLDSARVEVLQLNLRLQQLTKHKQEPDTEAPADDSNTDSPSLHSYSEVPFTRYLTAMIYEGLNEWSDAMIAYRHAYQAYRQHGSNLALDTPGFLQHDLLRLSDKMGLSAELASYKEAFGIQDYLSVADLKDKGELVFILHNGLAPRKKQTGIRVIDVTSGRLVSIALPYYVNTDYHAQHGVALIDDQQQTLTTVINIDAIARQTLAAQLPALTLRTIARAIVKDNTARQVEKNGGPLAALIINIAATVSEVADTRSWWSLPHDIQFMRLPLTPGRYDLSIELYDEDETLLTTLNFEQITLTAGQKTFIDHHWIRPSKPYPEDTHSQSGEEDHNET